MPHVKIFALMLSARFFLAGMDKAGRYLLILYLTNVIFIAFFQKMNKLPFHVRFSLRCLHLFDIIISLAQFTCRLGGLFSD